jgi:hypothetical protein
MHSGSLGFQGKHDSPGEVLVRSWLMRLAAVDQHRSFMHSLLLAHCRCGQIGASRDQKRLTPPV